MFHGNGDITDSGDDRRETRGENMIIPRYSFHEFEA